MKNLFKLMVVAAFALTISLHAAVPISGNSPIIDSTISTNGVLNYPYWPIKVQDATSVTNFVPVAIPYPYTQLALQFTCQGTNTTTTSNVVWTVYKSVSGGSPTNAQGTSLKFDVLGYVTNFLNGVTPVTTTAVYGPAPKAVSTFQSADNGIAGVPVVYVGSVITTTIGAITNYQVYASPK